MEIIKCELCGSIAYEGDIGESKYVCENKACIRSHPYWAANERKKKIQPYLVKIEGLKMFSEGTIDFYDARWKGDGSAEITLNNGETFMCHTKNGQFEPFDSDFFEELKINITSSGITEIKSNLLELIKLRNELYKI